MTKEFMPHMIKQKFGRIVNIASTAGKVGASGYSGYCASKAGLIGLSKVTALEGAPHNISCVSISPTWVETPMMNNAAIRHSKENNTTQEQAKKELKKIIEEMKVHEKEHCDFFENEIKKRKISPTKLLPLWDLLGVGLGFGSTLLGKKAAMLCTASVEEVIDEHYLSQIKQLGDDEKNLKKKITKFRQDELNHKDIAYEKGATKKGVYSILDLVIKTGSKIAINISEKI